MTDLVVLSLEAWDHHRRRNQYLVDELLATDPGLRVLFVEPAVDPLHELRRGFRPHRGRGLRRAGERLWCYEPTKPLPRRVDPAGDRRRARGVLRAAQRAGLSTPVLWINDPAGATVLRETGWPALYDITDDWLAAERTPAEQRRLRDDEAYLLRTCREVVACSPHLVATKGVDRPVTLVTNGVDVERYRRPVPRPADLPAGPTAVYVGTVHRDRFDVDLLRATARTLAAGAPRTGDTSGGTGTAGQRGTVVVVGPVLDLTTAEIARVRADGVVTLGRRAWDEVPGFLQHADVLLVPHLVDRFTESLDPIKAYEYRAVGRPVVATPVAGFRDTADPRVVVAEPADFPEVVRAALAGAGDAAAHADPDVPTWSGQARLMAEVVDRVLQPVATSS
ncbi:glycosyltransferase [Isoptericola sp. NPDC057191]|uniref:glycosyltransferase n=1 Tax=Isoptericola sp. NPDC057191 TaxID=3346041 RepID=UPI00362BBD0F